MWPAWTSCNRQICCTYTVGSFVLLVIGLKLSNTCLIDVNAYLDRMERSHGCTSDDMSYRSTPMRRFHQIMRHNASRTRGWRTAAHCCIGAFHSTRMGPGTACHRSLDGTDRTPRSRSEKKHIHISQSMPTNLFNYTQKNTTAYYEGKIYRHIPIKWEKSK